MGSLARLVSNLWTLGHSSLPGVCLKQNIFSLKFSNWYHNQTLEFSAYRSFPLTYHFNGFKSGVKRHLLSVHSFWTDLLYGLIFLYIFSYNSMSYSTVQPCMEWIPTTKLACVTLWLFVHLFLFYIAFCYMSLLADCQ